MTEESASKPVNRSSDRRQQPRAGDKTGASGQEDTATSSGEGLSLWTRAHVVPFVAFLLFLGLPDLLELFGVETGRQDQAWYLSEPRHWLYPVQTVACLLVLWRYRSQYQFRPIRGLPLAVTLGIVGTLFWLLPGWVYQHWSMPDGWWKHLGFADRSSGYQTDGLPGGQLVAGTVIAFRFMRLVVLVPFVEEILWRGFLMRFLVRPEGDYRSVPFGTFHWPSLFWVTLLFVLVHQPPDYAGAVVFGLLMYAVAVRTKSLAACIVMHAVANALLGTYVLYSQQWGYW